MLALSLPTGGHGFGTLLFCHTHILLVEGLKFLSISGVARFLPLEGGKLRMKGMEKGGSGGLPPEYFLESTSFRML